MKGAVRKYSISLFIGFCLLAVGLLASGDSDPTVGAFEGIWTGWDVADGSLVGLVISQEGTQLSAELTDCFSLNSAGTLIGGYSGTGSGTLSGSTAQIKFLLAGPYGEEADMLVNLELANNILSITVSNWNDVAISPPELWADLQLEHETSVSFGIGNFECPEVPESDCGQSVEPDNTLAEANVMGDLLESLCMDGWISGDVDYFAFTVLSENTVTIRTSLPDGGDTTLKLLDSSGLEIVSNDDDPSGGSQSYIQECLIPGQYYAVVGSFIETASFAYTLHVESGDACGAALSGCEHSVEPDNTVTEANVMGDLLESLCMDGWISGDVDYFAFTVLSENTVTIRTSLPDGGDTTLKLLDSSGLEIVSNDDDPSGGSQSYIQECLIPGQYYAVVGSFIETASFAYTLHVESGDACGAALSGCEHSVEPDNTVTEANVMGDLLESLCVDGWISGDVDYFAFTVLSENTVTIRTALPDGGDTTLKLLDSSGLEIVSNDDDPSGGSQSYIQECLIPGQYYAVVGSFIETASFAYTLHVESGDACGAALSGCEHSVEPDNTVTEANVMGDLLESLCMDGWISGDVDYFAFTVLSENTVTIRTTLPDGGDTTLKLLDSSGLEIVSNDDDPSGGSQSYIQECLISGQYYAVVGSFIETASFAYTLHVESGDACRTSETPGP